jgi:hypothetical protein
MSTLCSTKKILHCKANYLVELRVNKSHKPMI